CAAASFGRTVRRAATAAVCLLAAWLIAPGLPSWAGGFSRHLSASPPPPAVLALLLISRRPADTTASIAIAAASTICLLASFVPSVRRRLPLAVAALAALTAAAMGAGSFLRELSEAAPLRQEAARFLARLDAVPPLPGTGGRELVLDPPGSLADLEAARPLRRAVTGPDGLAGATAIRVLRWAPPQDEGPLSIQPSELHPVIEGPVDEPTALWSPPADARLPARAAADEPEFRFAFEDPPPDVSSLHVVILAETRGRARVIDRDLEEAIVQRSRDGAHTVYAWRPAWRPMACPERELRWEDGDVGDKGRSFWWTVAVVT